MLLDAGLQPSELDTMDPALAAGLLDLLEARASHAAEQRREAERRHAR